jgi:hypothetical protein
MTEYGRFTQEVKSKGQYVGGAQLQPTTTATSVRIRNGTVEVRPLFETPASD